MSRYRIEYGWGDRGQALYAHFEADNEEKARETAIFLLHRIKINGAWIVHDNGDSSETHIPGERIDHSRWLGTG